MKRWITLVCNVVESVKQDACFPSILDFSECIWSVTEVREYKNGNYKLDSLCLTINLLIVLYTKIQVSHVLHRNMEAFREDMVSVGVSCLGQACVLCVHVCLGFFAFVGVSLLPVFSYQLA